MTTSRRFTPALLAALFLAACSSGGGGGAAAPYPTGPDALEGGDGNDTAATATPVSVGSSRRLSVFPAGDQDYFAVELTADVAYELSTDPLAPATDTRLYLYSYDGQTLTVLEEDDDYVGYDSVIHFTPPTTGTYVVMVRAYDLTYGVATYTLGVRLLVDEDLDGHSTFFDCDDQDHTVNPWEDEVPGDGIDQDCSGADALVASEPDAAEDDDTWQTARAMALATTDGQSILHKASVLRANQRTLHASGDADWFKLTVPPHGGVELTSFYDCAPTTLLDADAETVLDTQSCGGVTATNQSASPRIFYVRYELVADPMTPVFYAPFGFTLGVDVDGDGAHTRDWDPDCDDSDPTIHPEASEVAGDAVDQDCDGLPDL